jgi:5'-phosphate synthase pdxT subunit
MGVTTLEGVFIRAPRVVESGPEVRVIARRGADPVLLRQGNLLAATFHPELSADSPVIGCFARLVGGGR